jgi:predicted phosphodiesterase
MSKNQIYKDLTDKLSWVKRYDDYAKIKSKNILVTSDFHIPDINIPFFAWMMDVAKIHKVKDCLIAGDYFDQSMYSFFQNADKVDWGDELKAAQSVLEHMLKQFKSITMLLGNHDARLLRRLDYLLKFSDVVKMLTHDPRVRPSEYEKAEINNDWIAFHPKCYSRIAGNKAKLLAAKYQKHVIMTHGHATCHTFDISGRLHCVDIGGCVDVEKTEYVNKQTTDHPRWVNGFVILQQDQPLLFTSNDLDYKEFCKGLK